MTRLPVVRTNQASRDVESVVVYLAEEAGVEVALRFVDALETSYALLSEQPEIGRLYVPENVELGEIRAWRVHHFENYLVFYRVLEESLEIARVLHGSRDIWTLLGIEE